MSVIDETLRIGLQHHRAERYSEAEAAYGAVLSQAGDHVDALQLLGTLLHQMGRHEEAVGPLCRAVSLASDPANLLCNLGAVFTKLGRFEEALHVLKRGVANIPDDITMLQNLGNAYWLTGQVELSLETYQHASRLKPDNAALQFNVATLLLANGDFSQGWRNYECRWNRKPRPAGSVAREYDGSEPIGGRVLIYREQGIGEEIMFVSRVADVVGRAEHCAVGCDPRLVPLMRRSFPTVDVQAMTSVDHIPAEFEGSFDWQLPMGSLPLVELGDEVPVTRRRVPQAAYLKVDPVLRSHWRERLSVAGGGEHLRVGISWRGGTAAGVRRQKSTDLAHWLPLFSIPGIEWVDLQYGSQNQERDYLASAGGIALREFQEVDSRKELDNFAALLSSLDLVVTVSNATAHLAGAVGVPVWNLLSQPADWRWRTGTSTTDWYASMRLYRQPRAGEWEPVFSKVAADLRRIAARYADAA